MLIFAVTNSVAGQDSTFVSKNFKFRDGIYYSLESLKNNQPDFPWTATEAYFFSNPQTYVTQVESIYEKATGDAIDLRQVWGICRDGIPYIQTESKNEDHNLTSFAAIRVRGRICYFVVEKPSKEKVPVAAYNPVNGRPFRQGYVSKKKTLQTTKIMDWKTGEIADFTKSNFLFWIRGDQQLSKSVEALPDDNLDEKIFKSLLIYNDRHPVYIRNLKEE